MKKSELKQALRPLIKECVKEVMFEDGILSGIIVEVAKGLGATQTLVEHQAPTRPAPPVNRPRGDEDLIRAEQQRKMKQQQTRKQMLDAIGNATTINGVNLFEGVEPLAQGGSVTAPEAPTQGPLGGVAPSDPGVDISSIFSSNWSKLAKG